MQRFTLCMLHWSLQSRQNTNNFLNHTILKKEQYKKNMPIKYLAKTMMFLFSFQIRGGKKDWFLSFVPVWWRQLMSILQPLGLQLLQIPASVWLLHCRHLRPYSLLLFLPSSPWRVWWQLPGRLKMQHIKDISELFFTSH